MEENLKKLILILSFLSSLTSYSQKLSRGSEIGEIYFLGPTITVLNNAIYRSTDFGETIICSDSISQASHTIGAIVADKSQGVLYFTDIVESLYYSDNYGQYGSWEYKFGNIYSYLLGGRNEGHVYEYMVSHSENYGNTFINHSLNGFFGAMFTSEIDNQDSVGYALVEKWGEWDTLFLLITYNNFEDMVLQNKFYRYEEPLGWLSRGNENGELFSLVNDKTTIRYSNDFGYSWTTKNKLYLNNYTSIELSGGRQDGEVYLLLTFVKQMGEIKHIYIYHSLDYGETFTVYHPFSYGSDPFFIGFNAEPKIGIVPLTVDFFNESSGANLNYEWDFDNDGASDSFDQNPTFVYSDTGNYSVKLKVISPSKTDSIIKYGYIKVKDTITNIQSINQQKLIVSPNPCKDKISFDTRPGYKLIEIYDMNGKCHISKRLFQENKTEIIYLREFEKGIYILKIRAEQQDITKKIIKI